MGHEDVRFNSRTYIDVMYIDGKSVLRIGDPATRFSAATFLLKLSAEAIRDAFVMCWSSVYTGVPHFIMTDEGSKFREVFAGLSKIHDVALKKSGMQSHNSFGVGEWCHKPLREISKTQTRPSFDAATSLVGTINQVDK